MEGVQSLVENGARFMTFPPFVARGGGNGVGSQAGSFMAIFFSVSAGGMSVVGVLQGANFQLGPSL